MSQPAPTKPSKKVETKVKAGSAGAVVAGFVLWVLSEYAFGAAVPAPVEALVYLVVPAAVAYVAAYVAPHTPR